MSATEPQPGQPCYEARELGCTCHWIRGYGVGPVIEEWNEKIISFDENCVVTHKR